MIMINDLNKRDYVLVLDRSGSMSKTVKSSSNQTRWNAMQEVATSVARKCQELDDDGIDLYLFNNSFKKFENTTPEKIEEIFNKTSPNGGTDFVPVLSEVIKTHFSRSNKPTTVLVVTDGEPSDGATGQRELAKLIIETTKKLESGDDLGIEFLQVGDDPAARDFLRKLDDQLESAGAKYDIVDTKTFEELENMSLEEVLLAAVND